jgi:hypothetical protein
VKTVKRWCVGPIITLTVYPLLKNNTTALMIVDRSVFGGDIELGI